MNVDSKYIQQFKKGSLEMILLCLIEEKETYGYEIITELNNRGGTILGYAKEGTIYPILYRLEAAELVTCQVVQISERGAVKKVYSLTEKGKETLTELKSFWSEYVTCVNQFIDKEGR